MARVLYEVKDEIAWIRLNRPEVLNALSSEELGAFVGALRKAAGRSGGQGDHHLERRRFLCAGRI